MSKAMACTGIAPWRRMVLGLIVLGLIVQGGLGEAIFLRRQLRMWFPSTEHADRQQAESDFKEFTAFVETHVPKGAAMLYITADAKTEHIWAYFQLSYALYPSTVWWVTPVDRLSPVDWWISSPMTGQALNSLAQSRGAHYAIIDDLGVPENLVYSSLFEFRSRCFVLRLP